MYLTLQFLAMLSSIGKPHTDLQMFFVLFACYPWGAIKETLGGALPSEHKLKQAVGRSATTTGSRESDQTARKLTGAASQQVGKNNGMRGGICTTSGHRAHSLPSKGSVHHSGR